MTPAKILTAAFCFLASGAAAQGVSPPINCTIKPLRTVELSSSLSGIVAEVLVRPGSKVSAGDIIVELDTELAKADLMLAEARAAFEGSVHAAEIQRDSLKSRLTMLEKAVAERAVSRVEYESTLLEYELAKATVLRQKQDLALAVQEAVRARLVLDKATIRSPVSGVIGEDLIDPGENVLNRPVATVYVTQPMRVEAFVPIGSVPRIAALDAPYIIVNGNIQNPVPVFPDYISPVANLSSSTISVYFLLESDTILPGYKCILAQPN